MPEIPQSTHQIATMIRLRTWEASEERPVPIVNIGMIAVVDGLIGCEGGSIWLTPAGWELAERMIAAADDQLTLYRREQAGTLTPEQAERRHVA